VENPRLIVILLYILNIFIIEKAEARNDRVVIGRRPVQSVDLTFEPMRPHRGRDGVGVASVRPMNLHRFRNR